MTEVRVLSKRRAFERMRKGGLLVRIHVGEFEHEHFVVPGGPVNDETAKAIKRLPVLEMQTWRYHRE
jgi:hypothetical protein